MKREDREAYLNELRSIFPDEKDARLVVDLSFLKSASEDLQSFGNVQSEIFALRKRLGLPAWKLALLQDILDSIAWVNKLTGIYSQALTGLYLHLKRVEVEKFQTFETEKREAAAAPAPPSLLDRIEEVAP